MAWSGVASGVVEAAGKRRRRWWRAEAVDPGGEGRGVSDEGVASVSVSLIASRLPTPPHPSPPLLPRTRSLHEHTLPPTLQHRHSTCQKLRQT